MHYLQSGIRQRGSRIQGDLPFVRTGRTIVRPVSQSENEMGFFQEFLLKNHLRRARYLGFD